ncbi:MAG: hypothetical protein ACLFR7_05450 [Opitutales bacterium]
MSRGDLIHSLAVVGTGLAGEAAVRAALAAGLSPRDLCVVERGERLLAGWRHDRRPEVGPRAPRANWSTSGSHMLPHAWLDWLEGAEATPLAEGAVRPAAERWQAELKGAEVALRLGAKAVDIGRDADGHHRVWFDHGPPITTRRLILATGGGRNHAFTWAEERAIALAPRLPAGLNLRLSATRRKTWNQLPPHPVGLRLREKGTQHAPSVEGELESVYPWLRGAALHRLTARFPQRLAEASYRGELVVNWVPAVGDGLSTAVLQRFQEQAGRRGVAEFPWEGLPAPLWSYLVGAAKLPPAEPWRSLAPRQLQALGTQLTSSRLPFHGYGLDRVAGFFAGGVLLGELVPGTFELQREEGLHWVGEAVDLHGDEPIANAWLAAAQGTAAALGALATLG